MFFATKEDITVLFCVNNRKLNVLTLHGTCWILGMNAFIDLPKNATSSLALDAKSSFWPLELGLKDRERTSFSNSADHFNTLACPFDLDSTQENSNAYNILSTVNQHFPCVFLEDIMVCWCTPEGFIKHTVQVLTILHHDRAKRQMIKCPFSRAASTTSHMQFDRENSRLRFWLSERYKIFARPLLSRDFDHSLVYENFSQDSHLSLTRISLRLAKEIRKNKRAQIWTLNKDDSHALATSHQNLMSPFLHISLRFQGKRENSRLTQTP